MTARAARNISIGASADTGNTSVELRLHGSKDKIFATAALPADEDVVEAFCARVRSEAAKARVSALAREIQP